MTAVSLASLLIAETKTAIYQAGLSIASIIGVPVTSWQAGDPTRALFHAQAEALYTREAIAAGYIGSGFLDYATGDWLKILAAQQFGVIVPEATAATTDVVLSNAGGGLYEIEAGDLSLKNSTTGKTYTNTTGGTLASGPGTTLTVTVVADEAGAASSATVGEIDEMVTTLLGVTCTNALAAVGVDEQDEESTRIQCRARRARATTNGPADAYTDVALDSTLTGTSAVTRARSYGDSDYGDVTLYVAGPSGAVSEPVRALVEAAILSNAVPIGITPTVLSVTNVVVPVTYSVWIYKRGNMSSDVFKEAAEAALEQMLAIRPIGGDIISPDTTGKLYLSLIKSTLQAVSPEVFRVEVSLPAGDTALTNGQVAVMGTPSATVNIVSDPT